MRRLLMLLSVMLLAVSLVHGQWLPPMIKAEIPFDFYVGNKAMPAGAYEINYTRITGSNPLLIVRKADSGFPGVEILGSLREDRQLSGNGFVLVFYKYDNDHSFLRQVRGDATASTLDLPSCRRERDHVTSTFTPVASRTPVKVVVLASVRP